MPHVDTDGASIWYESAGPALHTPTVVLLHGMSGTGEVWSQQLDPMHRAGYRTVTIDRRGAGRSLDRGSGSGSSAGDVLAVLDHLQIGAAHLVGHALGAADALELAVHDHLRVESVVVSNGHGGVVDGPFPSWLTQMWEAEIMALPHHLRELSATYRATDPEGTSRWRSIVESAAPADLQIPPRRGVGVSDLSTIQVPALFVAGDADLLVPPFFIRRLAEFTPGSRFVIVPKTGHVSHWEHPTDWNRAVLEFIDGVSTA